MSLRLALVLCLCPLTLAAVTLPHTFANGTVADADEINANFAALRDAIGATGVSCAAILAAGGSIGDGMYRLDPDGDGPAPAREAWCDMTGGGDTVFDARTLTWTDWSGISEARMTSPSHLVCDDGDGGSCDAVLTLPITSFTEMEVVFDVGDSPSSVCNGARWEAALRIPGADGRMGRTDSGTNNSVIDMNNSSSGRSFAPVQYDRSQKRLTYTFDGTNYSLEVLDIDSGTAFSATATPAPGAAVTHVLPFRWVSADTRCGNWRTAVYAKDLTIREVRVR